MKPQDIKDIGKIYEMFTNNGLVTDNETMEYVVDDDGEIDRWEINDLLSTTDLTRFIPDAVQYIIREAIEPNLLIIPNLFTQIDMPTARLVQIGSIGSMRAAEIPEGTEYPPADLDMDGGSAVAITVSKYGLQINVTKEVLDESSWGIVGLWLKSAGRALARLKEQKAAQLINEVGLTVFDNGSPTATADPTMYGTTQGRDITGAFNGSMTLNDIFDLYAFQAMRGFMPNRLLMNPLAWGVFAADPEMKEIVLKGQMLASRKMPSGTYAPGWGTTHEGRGIRTTATGSGVGRGYGSAAGSPTGVIGPSPWVNTLNPLGATFNIAPEYLPGPLGVIVSPFMPFLQGGATVSTGTPEVSRSYPTTTIAMADSEACGILIQKSAATIDEWDDPSRDIKAMKIAERWGMGMTEQGKGIALARNVVIARNYVFQNTNSVTLPEHSVAALGSGVTINT